MTDAAVAQPPYPAMETQYTIAMNATSVVMP